MQEDNDSKNLGEAVAQLRSERGMSLRALAAAADVDATWLMRLERGQYHSPDGRLLRQLAGALEVPPADLMIAAGFEDTAALPGLGIYLRTKYEMPNEAVAQLEAHFRLLDEKHRRTARNE